MGGSYESYKFYIFIIAVIIWIIIFIFRVRNSTWGDRSGGSWGGSWNMWGRDKRFSYFFDEKTPKYNIENELESVTMTPDQQHIIWSRAAEKLGLTLSSETSGYHDLTGTLDDCKISVEVMEANDDSMMTVYRVAFPANLELGLLLARDEPAVLKIMFKGRKRLFAEKYFPKLFNADLAFSANDESEAARYLNELRRRALMNLFKNFPAVIVTDSFILVRTNGVEFDPNRIIASVGKVLTVCKTIADAPHQYEDVQPDLEYEKEVEAEAEELLHAIEEAELVEEPKVQIRQEKFSEKDDDAEKFYVDFKPREDKKEEDDDEIEYDDPQPVISKLFQNAFPSQAEKDYFASIKGESVTWYGTLKSAYEYRSDFVFGNSPGVRAVFDICEMEEKFGKTTIKAVVAFPPESFDTLRSGTRKSFVFTGNLEKFESFAKEIYMKNGELIFLEED